MPFCPECGKNVSATQKFCRHCGASLIEELPAASPSPEAAPKEPLTCRSCGGPLAPDEKFCGTCGTKAGEASPVSAPVTPAPAPIPVPAPAPVVVPPPPPQPPASKCPSCGAPLTPEMKFCGSCGTLTKTGAPAIPPAPAAVSPPPPPPPATNQSHVTEAPRTAGRAGMRSNRVTSSAANAWSGCRTSSRSCPAGIPTSAAHPRPSSSPPPPSQPPSPFEADPLPAQLSAPRTCRACGNPIKPGDKFCSKCLVRVPDGPPSAPSQAPPPPPSASAPYVCASCGSSISGREKFCGICGSPAVAARASPAPAPAPSGKFCGKCGGPISDTTKFCGTCGSPVSAAPVDSSAPRPAPATVVTGGEEVVGVIANARKTKLLGADYFNIVVTDRRMILAQMTQPMLNAAIMEAQARAKAEGKGFFAIMKDQMAAQFQFAKRYDTMPPDQALAETAGNRAIPNDRVTAISMKLRDGGSGEVEYMEFKMTIDSTDGKFEFMIGEDDRFTNLLKHVYGEKVHMPFGYMRAGGVRIKFF